MGEIKENKCLKILVKKFNSEDDPNVRANIVRSLFFINSKSIPLSLFKKFINDKYYPIPLMAVKFISLSKNLHSRISFNKLYESTKNTIFKAELLRNIRFFSTKNSTLNLLFNDLVKDNQILKTEIIEAIGLVNSPDSLDILIEYYEQKKDYFLKDLLLSDSLIRSVINLCQSKSYNILYQIYLVHKNFNLRKKIIEALITVGGPKSLEILNKLIKIEVNEQLKKLITTETKKVNIIDF